MNTSVFMGASGYRYAKWDNFDAGQELMRVPTSESILPILQYSFYHTGGSTNESTENNTGSCRSRRTCRITDDIRLC
ncbi:MAG: hypothetical protein WBO57_03560, partial [Gammaproteobacteria bacterium]